MQAKEQYRLVSKKEVLGLCTVLCFCVIFFLCVCVFGLFLELLRRGRNQIALCLSARREPTGWCTDLRWEHTKIGNSIHRRMRLHADISGLAWKQRCLKIDYTPPLYFPGALIIATHDASLQLQVINILHRIGECGGFEAAVWTKLRGPQYHNVSLVSLSAIILGNKFQ